MLDWQWARRLSGGVRSWKKLVMSRSIYSSSIGNAAIQQMEHKKREEVPSSLLRHIPIRYRPLSFAPGRSYCNPSPRFALAVDANVTFAGCRANESFARQPQ
jgi:hypothetical protein